MVRSTITLRPQEETLRNCPLALLYVPTFTFRQAYACRVMCMALASPPPAYLTAGTLFCRPHRHSKPALAQPFRGREATQLLAREHNGGAWYDLARIYICDMWFAAIVSRFAIEHALFEIVR